MVDLITKSRNLEDAMLADYPGIIIPTKQYEKNSSAGVSFYRFKNLEEETLMKFLENYKQCNYVVLNEKGTVISNNLGEDRSTTINQISGADTWLEILQDWKTNDLVSDN